ncbi:MAG: SUMF1/EgtB/PvdO family nonheme iron enzyme [Chitinispirillia bacterium]|nr:SUMF1/EgtB/PvdO family nonheme iron enzyme [Chitinispirillia bacterium]MCL2242172.1 SUMF1/EgtB/PvdO family nonheme iron enzyme [Chitinispirillia bacterium]
MSKSVRNRQVTRKNTRVLAAALFALVLAGNAFSQIVAPNGADATVPVTVNVAANVKVDPPASGSGTFQGSTGSVTANTQALFPIKLTAGNGSGGGNTSVSHQAQRQAGGAWISHNRGNITLNLNSQQYNNAAVSLHSINGKRILSGSASASKGALNISRVNIPTGVYLLSVKGTAGNSFTTKLTHSGDNLNINVAFAANNPSLNKSAAAGDYGTWTITVTATGYITQTRTFQPDTGKNTAQSFTLVAAATPDAKSFTETVNGTSFDMIYVEGGTFTLGCESGTCPADAAPVSGVKVSNYFIAKNEVTNGLWKAVMGSNDSRVPSYAQNSGSMTNMTWYDAMEFACKLSQLTGKNYRMTTEAEWEYAAKKPNSSGMGNMNSNEEWAYNSWLTTHTGGTDPVGQITYADGKINLHTQKTRRDAQLTASNITGRLIRSIDGIGPALRLTLSADTDFPPNYVPVCEIHPPVLGTEPLNSYRDMRWVTGSDKHWTTGSIAIGSFDLRVWEDGTARLGSTNGQWFTSNNIAFVFVPSSGSARKFPYIFLDETQGSLISDVSFMSGGFIGRIAKESTTNYAKPSVTLAASAEALAKTMSNFETDYKMVDMVNIPASAKKQDSRLLDGTSQGWFQDNRTAGGQHHYRKDIDADEFRFTVNQGGQRTMLANGTWFTVNNTFLRVTHSGGYVADYLYTIAGNTFYHNSFMAYERADFRMFEKTENGSSVFSATCGSTCSGEIPKNQSAPVYANMGETGKSTFVPAKCPSGGCN